MNLTNRGKTDATTILQKTGEVLKERGKDRDHPKGERSMAQTIKIFNAITGLEMGEDEGWLFMMSLKLARANQGKFQQDDYLDLVGYSALLAEHKLTTQKG